MLLKTNLHIQERTIEIVVKIMAILKLSQTVGYIPKKGKT
jgi:hypothetical protein